MVGWCDDHVAPAGLLQGAASSAAPAWVAGALQSAPSGVGPERRPSWRGAWFWTDRPGGAPTPELVI